LLGFWFAAVVLLELKPRFKLLLEHIRSPDKLMYDGEMYVHALPSKHILMFFGAMFVILMGSTLGMLAIDANTYEMPQVYQ
jgi:hypothetical protein